MGAQLIPIVLLVSPLWELCSTPTFNLHYLTCHVLVSNADTHAYFQIGAEIQFYFITAFKLEENLRVVCLEVLTRMFSFHYQCSSVPAWLEQLPLAPVSYLHSSVFI